jgi:hypothetical protein
MAVKRYHLYYVLFSCGVWFPSLYLEGPEGVKRELGLIYFRLGKWDLGCWDRDLATGNGKWSPQKWEWDWGNMRVDSQFFHVLSILKYNFDPFLVSLVMIFVVNYIIHSTTCEQAYSGARNSGFSDYACLRMLQMPFPGFKFKNFPPWAPTPQYFIKCPPLAHTVAA